MMLLSYLDKVYAGASMLNSTRAASKQSLWYINLT